MAASTEQQLKDKKKNRFRERFLLTQAASLDEVVTSSAGSMEGNESSRTAASGNLSNCSRMRRMLFRRTRSETEDRTRNSRDSKADSASNSAPQQVHSRLNFTPQSAVLEEVATAPTAVTRLHSLMPRSPPPPYDNNSESGSVRSGSICPPTYDEAMAQNGPAENSQNLSTTMLTAMPIGYCNCRECQARYYNAEEEEQEDNCGDAVFPMETHVLMQEASCDIKMWGKYLHKIQDQRRLEKKISFPGAAKRQGNYRSETESEYSQLQFLISQ